MDSFESKLQILQPGTQSKMSSIWSAPPAMTDFAFRTLDEVELIVFDLWECDLKTYGVKQYFVVKQFIEHENSNNIIGEFNTFDDALKAFDNTTHTMDFNGQVFLDEVRRYVGTDFKKTRLEFEVGHDGITFSKN